MVNHHSRVSTNDFPQYCFKKLLRNLNQFLIRKVSYKKVWIRWAKINYLFLVLFDKFRYFGVSFSCLSKNIFWGLIFKYMIFRSLIFRVHGILGYYFGFFMNINPIYGSVSKNKNISKKIGYIGLFSFDSVMFWGSVFPELRYLRDAVKWMNSSGLLEYGGLHKKR